MIPFLQYSERRFNHQRGVCRVKPSLDRGTYTYIHIYIIVDCWSKGPCRHCPLQRPPGFQHETPAKDKRGIRERFAKVNCYLRRMAVCRKGSLDQPPIYIYIHMHTYMHACMHAYIHTYVELKDPPTHRYLALFPNSSMFIDAANKDYCRGAICGSWMAQRSCSGIETWHKRQCQKALAGRWTHWALGFTWIYHELP